MPCLVKNKLNISYPFLLIFISLLIWSSENVTAQSNSLENDSLRAGKDVIDFFVKFTKRNRTKNPAAGNKKVFFSLLPVGGGSDQRMSISTVNAAFYLGNPETTNLSNISFYPATNFKSYFQFKIFPNLWLDDNTWNITGKFEFSRINQNTYGLGANTSSDSLNIIDYSLIRANPNFNREVMPHFFIGIGYSLDYYYNIYEEWTKSYSSEFKSYNYGTSSNVLSSGITFNFLYDSRKNSLNPLQGLYSNLKLLLNLPMLGSDNRWSSIYFDTRKYISFSSVRHRTLALWGLYWATWGDVPYLNLPGNALDYSGWTGRGYWRGRYRGKQMLYGETEYRFDITRNGLIGGVLFFNAETFTEPDTRKFEYILPAAGTGLRLKFNKYSDSNITGDIAFGKDSFNYYISLNEAF